MFVVAKIEGKRRMYVTRPGSEHSYSKRLEDAQTWSTREQAEHTRCENEAVYSVAYLLGH